MSVITPQLPTVVGETVAPTAPTVTPTDGLFTPTDTDIQTDATETAVTTADPTSAAQTTTSSSTTSMPNFTSKTTPVSSTTKSSLPPIITASQVVSAAPLATGPAIDGSAAAKTRAITIGASVTGGIVLIGFLLLFFCCIRPRKPNLSPERQSQLYLLNRESMAGSRNSGSYNRSSYASNASARTSMDVPKNSANEFGGLDGIPMRPSTLPQRRSNLVHSYTSEDSNAPLLTSHSSDGPSQRQQAPPRDYFSSQNVNAGESTSLTSSYQNDPFNPQSSDSGFGYTPPTSQPLYSPYQDSNSNNASTSRDINPPRSSWVDSTSALLGIDGSSAAAHAYTAPGSDESISLLGSSTAYSPHVRPGPLIVAGSTSTTSESSGHSEQSTLLRTSSNDDGSYYDHNLSPRDDGSSLSYSSRSSSMTSTDSSVSSTGTARSARRQSSRPLPSAPAPPGHGPRPIGGTR